MTSMPGRASGRAVATAALALAAVAIPGLPIAAQTGGPAIERRIAPLIPPSPAPRSFIADVPRVLDQAARERLDARIGAIQDSGLADIGVAILPTIGDYEAYEVGVGIYRSWGIGRRDSLGSAQRDLGVLRLIVPKEIAPDSAGHCWITTGLGSEGIITDGEGGEICRTRIIPRLRELDHEQAIAAGLDAIVEQMRRDEGLAARTALGAGALEAGPQAPGSAAVRRTRNAFTAALIAGGVLSLLLIVGFALWWRRHGPKKCEKCGQRMRRLAEDRDDASLDPAQRLEERIGSVDYDVWECQCGEQMIRSHDALFTRYHRCPACKVRAARTTRRVLDQPTYVSTGTAEDTERCEHCQHTSVKRVTLPRKTPPAASGSGGGGGRRGGGGGGRSFGGSGRTSGGGGGGRY